MSQVKIDKTLDHGQFRNVWCQAAGRSPSPPDGKVVAADGVNLYVETGTGIAARRIVSPPPYAVALEAAR